MEIIDHNKITNHLIGVMDDETEAYLKVRYWCGLGCAAQVLEC